MEALLTWRYFLIPEDKFPEIQPKAEELDSMSDRELSDEENERKEALIDEINALAEQLASKVIVYADSDSKKDGTITEELVYRMDESPEVSDYSEDFYFPFMAYIKPLDLQEKYETIKEIFSDIDCHDLLREEFEDREDYLDRAAEIFDELQVMYKEAYETKCGVLKTDKLEWAGEETEDELSCDLPDMVRFVETDEMDDEVAADEEASVSK